MSAETKKFYCVRQAVFFLGNEQIDTFHYTMFHGTAKRGTTFAEDRGYCLGDSYVFPLRLFTYIARVSPIIQPHGNLLLNSSFRDRLNGFDNIDLLRCTIEGLCRVPYREGNFDHFDFLPTDVEDPPEAFLHNQCRPPGPSDDVPEYLELICPRLDQVMGDEAPEVLKATFPDIQEEVEVPMNSATASYAMVWHEGYFLFQQTLYEKIADLLNPIYFRVQVLQQP